MTEIEQFKAIIKKHKLEEKAEEIANYITSKKKEQFSLKEFAEHFNLPMGEAEHLVKTIYKAVQARKKFLKE